jgi:hypothetical protein
LVSDRGRLREEKISTGDLTNPDGITNADASFCSDANEDLFDEEHRIRWMSWEDHYEMLRLYGRSASSM